MSGLDLLTVNGQMTGIRPLPYNPTGFGEVAGAAFGNMMLRTEMGANLFVKPHIFDQAIEDRENLIRQRFGQDSSNLTGVAKKYTNPTFDGRVKMAQEKNAILDSMIVEGRKADPQKWAGIMTLEEIKAFTEEEKKNVARFAREDSERATAQASSGFTALSGNIVGGIGGAMTDPINLATLPFGAGAGVSILRAMGTEALLNAAVEAVEAPLVAAWQKELGYKYGFGDAAADIAFAGAGGAALTGAIRSLPAAARATGRALRSAGSSGMRILDAVARSERMPSSVRSAAQYMSRVAHIDEEIPRRFDENGKEVPSTREDVAAHRRDVQETQEAFKNYREPVLENRKAFVDKDDFDWLTGRVVETEKAASPPPPREFKLGALENGRYRGYTPITRQMSNWVENVVGELENTRGGELFFREVDGQGGTMEIMGFKGNTPAWFRSYNESVTANNRARAKALEKNRKLPLDQQKPVPPSQSILTRAKARKVADKMKAGQPLGKEEGRIASVLYDVAMDMRQRNVSEMVAFREARAEDSAASISAIAAREAADIEADMAMRPQNAADDMANSVRAAEDETIAETWRAEFEALLNSKGDMKILTEDGEMSLKDVADGLKENQTILDAIRTCSIR